MLRKTLLNISGTKSSWKTLNLQSTRCRKYSSQAKPQTSQVNGDTTKPLIEKTLGDLLIEKSNTWEHRDAFKPMHQQYRWTFVELLKWTNFLAIGFRDLDATGKEILLNIRDDAEYVIANLAGTRSGAKIINHPHTTDVNQFAEVIDATKPTLLFINPKLIKKEKMHELIKELRNWDVSVDGTFSTRRFPSLRWIIQTSNRSYNGMVTMRDILGKNRRPDPLPKLNATFKPTDKTVSFLTGNYGSNPTELQEHVFTHRSIANTSQSIGEKIKLKTGDRVTSALPLSSYEGQIGIWSNINYGAFTVIPSEKFEPEGVLKAATTEKCNYLYLQPRQAIEVLSLPNLNKYNLSGIESVLLAGNTNNAELKKAVDLISSTMQPKQLFGYSDGVVFDFKNSGKGSPLSHVQVKVVDNKKSTAPLNSTGTLVTKGIHNRTETISSKGKDESEWVSQGTQAKIDNDGFIHLV